jgi:quercetin dioxygenase-like cupin family protein
LVSNNLTQKEHHFMDTTELADRWQRDGYDVETRQVMPNSSRPAHTHPFDARGLILAGELTLTWEGQTHTFRVGEVYDIPAGCIHGEQYGSEMITVLVGRRHHSSDVGAKR